MNITDPREAPPPPEPPTATEAERQIMHNFFRVTWCGDFGGNAYCLWMVTPGEFDIRFAEVHESQRAAGECAWVLARHIIKAADFLKVIARPRRNPERNGEDEY